MSAIRSYSVELSVIANGKRAARVLAERAYSAKEASYQARLQARRLWTHCHKIRTVGVSPDESATAELETA